MDAKFLHILPCNVTFGIEFGWSLPNTQSTYMLSYLYFSFHVCQINNTVHIPHVRSTSAC